mmetsp:Transcript_69725/g.123414  ORF Transcript_69725/g.123414 Transcript_69725/m.123414 type:complete len:84 (+) Transcript_69725:297-548(+)
MGSKGVAPVGGTGTERCGRGGRDDSRRGDGSGGPGTDGVRLKCCGCWGAGVEGVIEPPAPAFICMAWLSSTERVPNDGVSKKC